MSVSAALTFKGRTASPGFAEGPFVRVDQVRVHGRDPGNSREEDKALRDALAASNDQLVALARTIAGDAAEILEFQLALLEDEGLLEPIFAAIAAGAAADIAWSHGLTEQIDDYRANPDDYLHARAADLIDLRDRVLAALDGGPHATGEFPAGAVICAEDLPPSRFLEIDWSAGGGLALLQGSTMSHVAILARARGVPMVVQLGALPNVAAAALLDGEGATLELDPPAARIADFKNRRAAHTRETAAARNVLAGPPVSWCGERVRLHLNIQGPDDLSHPDAQYADGIGLMRTEFLFEGPAGLPDEEAQLGIYESVLRWAGDRPVTIRTVDAGGDKPIPGFTENGEANPFLGVRGLRLSLKRPEIFAVQLRALARAAVHGRLKVMFPMVTVPAEFAAACNLFKATVEELRVAGVDAALPELGIMVEVPSAALTIDAFPAAFFSIGSNDLTQYVTACDRTNGALGGLGDPLNPGVLELIRRTAQHGRRQAVEVSLCGDMAGDPRFAAALLECGLREFSMSPPSLSRVKQAIARLSSEGSLG
ncbi:MAG: phosphoenolpyruvate--protein phosphotransferase [Alphaproteobacteria bacterium]|nr:phosphoenolpyruvate--protein phosphotransferase [Alphaproteobacteria bacterium]